VNRPTPGAQLDVRSLRYFVAVAEELHFTRAATRMFIAQQALSREIAQLERQLGVPLFMRTTRRVALTPAGERLLVRARELVALHDRAVAEVLDVERATVVNLHSSGRRTGSRVLELARELAPNLEFRGRHGPGLGDAIGALEAGEVDVAFGRVGGVGRLPPGLQHQLIRFEPLAVLLPEQHPLARHHDVPAVALRDQEVDAGIANAKAPEWADLAEQLLDHIGARATPPHVPAEGTKEQALHLVRQGLPILTGFDHVPVPGGQLRMLVEPRALYPWSLVYRANSTASGVRILIDAAARLAAEEGWLQMPPDAWLPEPEATEQRNRRQRDRAQPDTIETRDREHQP
jgi:DNA-binding transcriptional LysR family regulator